MNNSNFRELLISMLHGEHAHVSFDNALKKLPEIMIGRKPENFPYSIWELVEHIRITQWDIVNFSSKPDHISPRWPEEYWPGSTGPSDSREWEKSIRAIKRDRNKMIKLIGDTKNDLLKPFPHGDGQNLLREAILIIDHTSYHAGQIILIRKLLGIW